MIKLGKAESIRQDAEYLIEKAKLIGIWSQRLFLFTLTNMKIYQYKISYEKTLNLSITFVSAGFFLIANQSKR